jgi:hypothetical protein
LYLCCEFEELQAQFMRNVIHVDVCQALAPGALESFFDGAGAREVKRGSFEPVVNTRS